MCLSEPAIKVGQDRGNYDESNTTTDSPCPLLFDWVGLLLVGVRKTALDAEKSAPLNEFKKFEQVRLP
jgi:hypothetical protein